MCYTFINDIILLHYLLHYLTLLMTSQGAFAKVGNAAEPDRTSVGVRDSQTGGRGSVFLHSNRHGRTRPFHQHHADRDQ